MSTTTESMKTNNIPLKSPIKLPPEMQKNFWIFQNLLVFRAFFEKSVFWENGRGRHQMGTTLIHYTSIFIESQWGSPPESFIQKYWLVSNLPIFQNYCFFKKGPKNQQILKNSQIFFCISGGNFIGLFNGILFAFILLVVWAVQTKTSNWKG